MHALLRRRQQLDPAADRPDLAAAGSAEHLSRRRQWRCMIQWQQLNGGRHNPEAPSSGEIGDGNETTQP